MKNPEPRLIIHCFTGTKDFAKKLLDFGAYISFSGIITFKKNNELREVVKYVPEDRILIETDCLIYLQNHIEAKRIHLKI